MPQSRANRQHHKIVILAGRRRSHSRGQAAVGRRNGAAHPATALYYQPLWILVGGSLPTIGKTVRKQRDVMRKGATWPAEGRALAPIRTQRHHRRRDRLVRLPHGARQAAGLHRVPGLTERLGNGVSSNYLAETARTTTARTTGYLRGPRNGTTVFGHAQPADQMRRRAREDRVLRGGLLVPAWRAEGFVWCWCWCCDARHVRSPGLREGIAPYGIGLQFNSEPCRLSRAGVMRWSRTARTTQGRDRLRPAAPASLSAARPDR